MTMFSGEKPRPMWNFIDRFNGRTWSVLYSVYPLRWYQIVVVQVPAVWAEHQFDKD